jgi:tripartite-type tricarboxylate transporter receptor subunit TctC
MGSARLPAIFLSAVFAFPAPAATVSDGNYPSRTIQLMIPSSKGGGADISFRILAQAMEPILGQKIEILNKPSDSGAEGLTELASDVPDGYHLGAVWNGPLTASPQIRKLPYTLDSFTAVASTFISDYVLCAHRHFTADSGAALVEAVRTKPFTYSYGSEGKGGSGYFAAESLFEGLGLFLRGEGFDGSAEAAKAFGEHKIDFYFGTTPAIMPQVKAGEAKCLLTLSSRKLDVLPGATPAKELGAPPNHISLWRFIVAPKGLALGRLAKLEAAIRGAMEAPTVKAFLADSGERPFVNGAAETMRLLKDEFAAFSALANRLGLKAE